MTTKGRNKEKARLERLGLLEPNPARRETGIGRQRHQVDGGWGRAKTIFDSDLYRVLIEIINDALHHAEAAPLPADAPLDFDLIAEVVGLTEKQARALELHSDGHSHAEIAEVMDATESGVRGLLARGIRKLRKRADEGGTPPALSLAQEGHFE